MCDCITDVNRLLAEHNGRLVCTYNLTSGRDYPKLEVEKADRKNRKKPPLMIPTFCPFCGERYKADQGVEEIPLDAAAKEG